MKKVIVAGSREFTDKDYIYTKLNELLEGYKEFNEVEIVQGECRGVDIIAKQYAIDNNLPYKSFPANWNLYGKSAGVLRNIEMAKYSDVLIAFYGGSRGTSNMIKEARKHGLKIHIVEV